MQKTPDGLFTGLHMNAVLAATLGLTTGSVKVQQDEGSVTVPLIIDETVPQGSVYLASGLRETVGLGRGYQTIHIQQASHE